MLDTSETTAVFLHKDGGVEKLLPDAAFGDSTVTDFDFGKRIHRWGSGEWITWNVENQHLLLMTKQHYFRQSEGPQGEAICGRREGAGRRHRELAWVLKGYMIHLD